MKKVRIIALCLTFCLCAGLFSGCGCKKEDDFVPDEATFVLDEATFEDAFSDDSGDALEDASNALGDASGNAPSE